MPKGPKGEKHPADEIGLAVVVGRIATGEIEDAPEDLNAAVAAMCSGTAVFARDNCTFPSGDGERRF